MAPERWKDAAETLEELAESVVPEWERLEGESMRDDQYDEEDFYD